MGRYVSRMPVPPPGIERGRVRYKLNYLTGMPRPLGCGASMAPIYGSWVPGEKEMDSDPLYFRGSRSFCHQSLSIR